MTRRPIDDRPRRFDEVVRAQLPGASRRLVRRLIADGEATLNGRRARKGDLVRPGDRVDVQPLPDLLAEPDLPVAIVAESPDVVALSKPAPMPTLPLDPRERGTLANFVAGRWPACRSIGTELATGILHRLDTGTSGIVLVARDEAVWRNVRGDFAARRVEKRYVALVAGRPSPGVIGAALAHDPSDRRRMRLARTGERSWDAETELLTVEPRGLYSLVEVRIRTGVTHQIRAHLAGIGTPVVGDCLYGAPPDPAWAKRHALHALSIALPARGGAGSTIWQAPPPASLERS